MKATFSENAHLKRPYWKSLSSRCCPAKSWMQLLFMYDVISPC